MLTKLAMPDVAVKGAQALVAAAGGLQAVYRAMQEHQHGAEVQAQACLALNVVACDRPDNQFRLMEFEPADVAKNTPDADGGMSGIERTAVFVASQADVRLAKRQKAENARAAFQHLARTVGEGQWDAVCEADPTRPSATPRGHHASARPEDSEPELVGPSGRGRRGWG